MLENTNDTQTIETQTAAPVDTSVVNTVVDADATPSEPAPYVPSDYKFKYTGKNGDKWGDAEGEIDEPIRALIKSKEDEEKWKKHYSKVHGFDFIVDGREKARTELTTYKTQAEPILKYAQEATKAWHANDLDKFFEVLGVPYEKLQQHVYSKLKHQELPPEQRNTIEQNRTMARQLQEMQEQVQSFQQNSFQTQQQALYNELSTELSKPDISAISKAFDQRTGQNGAFQEEIRQRGEYIYFSQNGRVARPSELVQDIINKYGLQAPVAQNPQVPANSTVPAQLSTDKPTIPVVQGGGASPSHKTVKSISDLAAIRQEKYGY